MTMLVNGQQKLILPMRVAHCPVLLKYCWAMTAVRPAGQVADAALGSIVTDEKSPNRVLLEVREPMTRLLLVPIRAGTPPPGLTPSNATEVARPQRLADAHHRCYLVTFGFAQYGDVGW